MMNYHALSKFHFCPVCGSDHFEINDFKSKRCADCGFVFYLNTSAAVVGIVLNDKGKFLVTRRGLEPARGLLDLPGGFVDMGESLEQALCREMEEETSQEVIFQKWLFSLPNIYRYSGLDVPTTDNFMLCTMMHPEDVEPHDDVSELLWLSPRELQVEDFGLQSVRMAIPHLLKMFG
ncbi:MAG: NUDIX domain-containing protein [Bacteroidaceae bacterium]|nr:NUDIX domain-containing protein [Bacteroidaceae bacterium]